MVQLNKHLLLLLALCAGAMAEALKITGVVAVANEQPKFTSLNTQSEFTTIDAQIDSKLPKFTTIDAQIGSKLPKFTGIDAQINSKLPKFTGIDAQIGTKLPKFTGIDAQINSKLPKFTGIDAQIHSKLPKFTGIDSQIHSKLTSVEGQPKVLLHELHNHDDGVHVLMLKVNGQMVHQMNVTKDGGVHDPKDDQILNLTATIQQLRDANKTSAAQAKMNRDLFCATMVELEDLKTTSRYELVAAIVAVSTFLLDMVVRVVQCAAQVSARNAAAPAAAPSPVQWRI